MEINIKASLGRLFESANRTPGHETYAKVAVAATRYPHLERQMADLQSVKYTDPAGDASSAIPDRPTLAVPKEGVKTDQDALTRLIAKVIQLLGKGAESRQNALAEMLRSVGKASAEGHQALSEKYQAAVAALEAAGLGTQAALAEGEKAKKALDGAQKELATAETALGNTSPGTPEHDAALAARDQAKARLDVAQQAMTKAETTFAAALQIYSTQNKVTTELGTQLQRIGSPNAEVLEGMKRELNAGAKQILLMMTIAEIMGDAAETKLATDLELYKERQASLQEYLVKESEKYREQVRKAEAASKAMGCIGKIVGALVAVVSVVAAPFTGGTSLILAGVGLALMGADMLVKELTGVSFMQEAMKPLMDNVLGPMIQGIGKGIADILKTMGVEGGAADMAGMILGAIIGALVMVVVVAVVAVVGKSAASRVASAMGEIFGKTLSKMVPDLLKHIASSASKSVGNLMTKVRSIFGLKSDANSLAIYANRLQMLETGIETVGTTSQAGLQVHKGVLDKKAAEHLDSANLTRVVTEQIQKSQEALAEFFEDSIKVSTNTIKQGTQRLDGSNETSLIMSKNI